MNMTAEKIIKQAANRRGESLLRRWSHYECLKDKLQNSDMTPKAYERAVREIARVLGL